MKILRTKTRSMRGLPVALALFALSAGVAPAATRDRDGVPTLNVQRSCREAQAVSADGVKEAPVAGQQDTYSACMQDEKQAHDQMAQKWTQFKPASRKSCVAAGITPSPSYVEILTCLEMNDEGSIPYKANGDVMPAPTSGRGQGSPSPRPQGSPSPGGSRL